MNSGHIIPLSVYRPADVRSLQKRNLQGMWISPKCLKLWWRRGGNEKCLYMEDTRPPDGGS